VCGNDNIAVKKYGTRHGHGEGWQLNCSNCGKFLIIQMEKRKTMTPAELFRAIFEQYKKDTKVQNYETFKAYIDKIIEIGREQLEKENEKVS
jgi:hypothetical protein